MAGAKPQLAESNFHDGNPMQEDAFLPARALQPPSHSSQRAGRKRSRTMHRRKHGKGLIQPHAAPTSHHPCAKSPQMPTAGPLPCSAPEGRTGICLFCEFSLKHGRKQPGLGSALATHQPALVSLPKSITCQPAGFCLGQGSVSS